MSETIKKLLAELKLYGCIQQGREVSAEKILQRWYEEQGFAVEVTSSEQLVAAATVEPDMEGQGIPAGLPRIGSWFKKDKS